MNVKTRLQNLRDFTVQIRHPLTNTVAGTGIVVSIDGTIITCASVLSAAGLDMSKTGGNSTHDIPDQEVSVYFPQVHDDQNPLHRARIHCISPRNDGFVLIKLVGDHAPLAPEQIAILGTAERSARNPFRSYRWYTPGESSIITGTILATTGVMQKGSTHPTSLKLKPDQPMDTMCGAAILDSQRNLIIGVVSPPPVQTTNIPAILTQQSSAASAESPGNKAATTWAANARIFSIAPFDLPIYNMPMRQNITHQPRTNKSLAQAMAVPRVGQALYAAPPPLMSRWIGQRPLLDTLNETWSNRTNRIIGIIGSAGTGKSSLVRRWIRKLETDKDTPQPDGIFWWNFAELPYIDEFLIKAFAHLSGKRIDPYTLTSSSVRGQILSQMLTSRRYIIVLDGIDTLQEQDGFNYGCITSPNLRDFLSYAASQEHGSLCIITSRIPLTDMHTQATYTQYTVAHFEPEQTYTLIQRIGLFGEPATINQLIRTCANHTLLLTIHASYIKEEYEGDIEAFAAETMLAEDPDESNDEQPLGSPTIADFCETYLTDIEYALLVFICLFRRPVPETALTHLLRGDDDYLTYLHTHTAFYTPIVELNDAAFQDLIERLVAYDMLIYDNILYSFTTHTLIRASILERLASDIEDITPPHIHFAHAQIAAYYLAHAPTISSPPTLDQLTPYIEACVHACRADTYDEAWTIYWTHIAQRSSHTLLHHLAAYETTLNVLSEFFPNHDTTQPSCVSELSHHQHIADDIALSYSRLDNLKAACIWHQRSLDIALQREDIQAASIRAYRLAHMHTDLGNLATATTYSEHALDLARQANHRPTELIILALQAHIAHLQGHLIMARAIFQWAETIEHELDSHNQFLMSFRGIWYAEHLRQTNQYEYAHRMTQTNLEHCQRFHWNDEISRCHRILADLANATDNHEEANQHYQEAIKIARGIPGNTQALTEALLARGLWAIRGFDETNDHYMLAPLPTTIRTRQRIASLLEKGIPYSETSDQREPIDLVQPTSITRKKTPARQIQITGNPRKFVVTSVGVRQRIRTGARQLRIERDFSQSTEQPQRAATPQPDLDTRTPEPRTGATKKQIPGMRQRFVTKERTPTDRPFTPRLENDTASTQAIEPQETLHTAPFPAATVSQQQGTIDSIAILDQRKTSMSEGATAFQIARSTLEEALSYAIATGYRIQEADIRLALARVYLAAGNNQTARIEAEYVQRMSQHMGYHWGQVAATDILDDL